MSYIINRAEDSKGLWIDCSKEPEHGELKIYRLFSDESWLADNELRVITVDERVEVLAWRLTRL